MKEDTKELFSILWSIIWLLAVMFIAFSLMWESHLEENDLLSLMGLAVAIILMNTAKD